MLLEPKENCLCSSIKDPFQKTYKTVAVIPPPDYALIYIGL